MIMKKQPGIIPCALFLGILNLALWTSVRPVTVRAGDLPHGPLTRPGSDWSKVLPAGDWADKEGELGDAAGLPKLVAALRARGYGEADLAKITHLNWLRIFRQTWK